MAVVLRQFGKIIETDVEAKVKFSNDSLNTAKNNSSVDRRAILSVTGYDTSMDKNIITTVFFSGYCDTLVKEEMEMFNSKTFMVMIREDIAI